jgi:hypothetical protein
VAVEDVKVIKGRKLISYRLAGTKLNLTPRSLSTTIAAGNLPFARWYIGGRPYLDESAVDDFILQTEVPPRRKRRA